MSSNNPNGTNLVPANQQQLQQLASPFAPPVQQQAPPQQLQPLAQNPAATMKDLASPYAQPPQQSAYPQSYAQPPHAQLPQNTSQVSYQQPTPTEPATFKQQVPANQQDVNFTNQQRTYNPVHQEQTQQPAGTQQNMALDMSGVMSNLFNYNVPAASANQQQQGIQNFEPQQEAPATQPPQELQPVKWLQPEITKDEWFAGFDENPMQVIRDITEHQTALSANAIEEKLQPVIAAIQHMANEFDALQEERRQASIRNIESAVVATLRNENIVLPNAIKQAVYATLSLHVDDKYEDYSRLYDSLQSMNQLHLLKQMNLLDANDQKMSIEAFITMSAIMEAKRMLAEVGQTSQNRPSETPYSTHPAVAATQAGAAGQPNAADLKNMTPAQLEHWASQRRVTR